MPGLIENYPVRDTFCAGLNRIERAGQGNFRLLLYVERDGDQELTASIIIPASELPDIIMKALCALAAAGIETAKSLPLLGAIMQ